MKKATRIALAAITALAAAGTATRDASAQGPSTGPSTELRTGSGQGYPARPVTMIVPYTPGGTAEVLGRPLAQEMSNALGRTVIVELRPGALPAGGGLVRYGPEFAGF